MPKQNPPSICRSSWKEYAEDIEKTRTLLLEECVETVGLSKRQAKDVVRTFDLVLEGKIREAHSGHFYWIHDILGCYRDEDSQIMERLYECFSLLWLMDQGLFRKKRLQEILEGVDPSDT